MSISKDGTNKLEDICRKLRQDTLEPAEKEAAAIIANAHEEAHSIIQLAKKEANLEKEKSQEQVKKYLNSGEEALRVSFQRVIDALKYDIENVLFGDSLSEWLDQELSDEKNIVLLIEALITSFREEGLDSDIMVSIGSKISAESINKLLAPLLVKKLKNKQVINGSFSTGVHVQIVNKKFIIQIDRESLEDHFQRYLQKDFRNMLFGKKKSAEQL
ncbi:V-type ATP synthase subunit E [Candidatus Clavichlamydia salmonicola]|uniref:hypothetical protein n=1 Tax=Candidatus Clavichlamydia salmonicola TaxID=469812 RepID=UPI001891E16E|nr:hypothetical protein [Candidatus Clavichlamydia salmonicola]MBF5051109.1 V-type ATP synthase subunit E [Candidatus Clavichlamydia salmonicola]